ncbi:MAG: DUF4249 domain-containing protein [Tannerella sp.]|jgi:hypothetical protein|nr:DUF4249 domain-containing protein [Tannerella sp.]
MKQLLKPKIYTGATTHPNPFRAAGLLLLLSLCASCVVNYDVDTSKITERNCLVVNSILNPSHPLTVRFHTVDRQDGGAYSCRAAAGVRVRLTAGGNVLYDDVCPDTILRLDIRPAANTLYRLEARKEGYGDVWAETAVPEAVTCRARVRKTTGGSRAETAIAYLSDFANFGREHQSALYISAYDQLAVTEWDPETGQVIVLDSIWTEVSDLYSRNFFIDILNRIGGMPLLHEEVGSLYFENFMRIRAENIRHLDTLAFAEAGRIIRIITAGTAYDSYVRTAYEQSFYHTMMAGGSTDINAMFYQPTPIYSNINGGLGIFAGINGITINN